MKIANGTDQEPFRVSADEKRLLLESIAQADRGEFAEADQTDQACRSAANS
jgi:hypothetical protein